MQSKTPQYISIHIDKQLHTLAPNNTHQNASEVNIGAIENIGVVIRTHDYDAAARAPAARHASKGHRHTKQTNFGRFASTPAS